ncbi:ABC transporter ATP-binding protein [Vallitalea guaymasensis]|uniref:ABC transporter ATP-binding protein n=1 Tax=Vallitalea guaymasensis TaxID=1185412 RepID=A0A8J8MBX1_9FIRM|nr:ABC transporter ATP-binding protein [Vallitalea guaymasensis]QUH30063.1 ABC transporter ATP-binding protein [Vallitalea guaymasensis]
MINVEHLSKNFEGTKALADISLHIKKGSIYGLVGPNGAGKTTLIKHLTGVYQQDDGQIKIDGNFVYENNEIKEKIAYVPDELYFFPQYTIKKMARFYREVFSTWNEERYEKLKDVFMIDENMKINKLSKGMKKQVAFWLCISYMPEVMILDEPVDGLDPVMRKKVWNLVVQDVAERQMTVLVSSHNLRELEDICDTVGIMHQGKLLIERELDDLKSDVYKIQVAFKGEFDKSILDGTKILHKENRGSIFLYILKGNREKTISIIEQSNPAILDILPLTLEEIFIYEMGGVGYEIKDIIL